MTERRGRQHWLLYYTLQSGEIDGYHIPQLERHSVLAASVQLGLLL